MQPPTTKNKIMQEDLSGTQLRLMSLSRDVPQVKTQRKAVTDTHMLEKKMGEACSVDIS